MSHYEERARVAESYDRTIREGLKGVDLYRELPERITSHPSFGPFSASEGNGSGNPAIKDYLAPMPGERFLDMGCCANILSYRLDEWPSEYHGVDVSGETIALLERVVKKDGRKAGGLYRAPVHAMPFLNGMFQLAACVGVLEYFPAGYAAEVLREVHRVLASGGRFYVDIPNTGHPGLEAMCMVEEHMGRPIMLRIPSADFAGMLKGLFRVMRTDFSRVMAGYSLVRD
jgi:SAM-dependent methyltransferase